MIADTTFFIDLFTGRENAKKIANKYYLTTTSLTVFELYQGLNSNEQNRLDKMLEEFKVLSFEKETAKTAGTLFQRLQKKGKEIDPEDCMIASIVLERDLTLLTNDSHFDRIPNLKVKNY